jgi:hypothetical protein
MKVSAENNNNFGYEKITIVNFYWHFLESPYSTHNFLLF